MNRFVQALVAIAALAVIGWVGWQVLAAAGGPDRAAMRERADCALAAADLERFLAGGRLPGGVDEEKLRLFVSICRSRQALDDLR